MKAAKDVSGKQSKVVAIVSHPDKEITELIHHITERNGERLAWEKMPPVHMLGRNTVDEQVTYDYLLGRTEHGGDHYPDGILVLVNASELDRQLYLASQLIDLRLPIVIALINPRGAARRGTTIDISRMAAQLGVPISSIDIETSDDDIAAVIASVEAALQAKSTAKPMHWRPSIALANAYHHLDKNWVFEHLKLHTGARLIEGLRLVGGARSMEEYAAHPDYEKLVEHVEKARGILEEKKENPAMAEVLQRTGWINQVIASSTTKSLISSEDTKDWKQRLKSYFGKS